MGNKRLSNILLICSVFSLFINPSLLWAKADPQEVIIISQPESELAKSVAEFLSFFTDGFKSVFKPLFVASDRVKDHLDKGENAQALKASVFKGIIIAVPPLMSILLLGGAKVGIKVIRKNILNPKPTILNKAQHPRYGHIDRIKDWWSNKNMQKMICDGNIKNKLSEIVKKTKMLIRLIRMGKKRTYTNLLLYGEPGTGKTLFAQTLAQETNMNFLPVTAASLLQSGIESIKYFDELIAMANHSAYGTIIFIDEADGLFIDRNLLNPDSDHYKILEHILSIIDGRSNKYMIIAATNRVHMIDNAMNRRFQDQIEIPLPAQSTRKKLIESYIKQLLCNEAEVNRKLAITARRIFTPDMIDSMVDMTAGLSHAEIATIMESIRNRAELNKEIIEAIDIEYALNEAQIRHTKKSPKS